MYMCMYTRVGVGVYTCACRVGGRQGGKKLSISVFMFLLFSELNVGKWKLHPDSRFMD